MATVSPEVQQDLGTLTALIRAMFPHASFPDGPYERAASAIAEAIGSDARMTVLHAQGLRELEAAGFLEMDDAAKLEHCRSISGSNFFGNVRAEVITTLYNDPEVWELLGWEGESYSKGGYVDRGFDDLDWLPEARV